MDYCKKYNLCVSNVETELDFYEAFNKIADVEKFKVQCTREVRLGSNIRDKVCLPKYVRNRMAQETQDGLNGGGYFPKYKEIGNFLEM